MYDSFRLLITKVSRNTSSCISSSFDWIWSISNHQKLSQHMLLYMFRSGINDSHSTLLFFSVHINCYHSLRYRARRFREDATKIGAHSVHAFDIPDVFSKALDDVETAHVQKINSLELHTAGQQWHAASQQCHGSPQAAKSTGHLSMFDSAIEEGVAKNIIWRHRAILCEAQEKRFHTNHQ